MVTLVAETICKGAGTKGVIGIACGLTGGLGGRGWADLTARTSDAGMGRVSARISINKLGMHGWVVGTSFEIFKFTLCNRDQVMGRIPMEESVKVKVPEDGEKVLVTDGKVDFRNVFITQRQH